MTLTASTVTTRDGAPDPDRPLRWFVGVPFRPQTYRSLLYLALAFPLGLVYFVGITVGLSMGAGLLITLLGVPLLLLTVIGTLIVAGFEARLSAHILGIDPPVPEALRADKPDSLTNAENGLLEALLATVMAPTTWTSFVLVFCKFLYGIVAFVALVTSGAIVATLLAAPFLYTDPAITYTVGYYTVTTLPVAIAVSIAGVFVGLISLHLLNALALAGGVLTAALLEIAPSEREA